jgi:tripartite tricarboxylate transporter family receptor
VSDRAIVIGRLRAVVRRSAVGTPAHGRAGSARVALVLLGTFFVCAQAAAQVEDWPNRPVTMVVPYEPGGIVDLAARLLADHMAKVFPQPFIIENRAGAGGTIGTQYVARANPDGGTLLVASVAQIAIAPLIQGVKYDPLNDFVPISMFSSGVIALAVSTGVTAKTTADLIAHAKANPGKLAYSSAGFGSFSHLGGAMFTSRAGIELLHVPYKGAFPAVQALLSDQVLRRQLRRIAAPGRGREAPTFGHRHARAVGPNARPAYDRGDFAGLPDGGLAGAARAGSDPSPDCKPPRTASDFSSQVPKRDCAVTKPLGHRGGQYGRRVRRKHSQGH